MLLAGHCLKFICGEESINFNGKQLIVKGACTISDLYIY